MQGGLSGFSPLKDPARDLLSGGCASREAGIGRLVPGEESCLPGSSADLRLCQTAESERRQHRKLFQRPHTGTVCCIITGIGPIYEDRISVCQSLPAHRAKDSFLAMIASAWRIGRDFITGQNVKLQNNRFYSERTGQTKCVLPFKGRLKGGAHIISSDLCAASEGCPQQ